MKQGGKRVGAGRYRDKHTKNRKPRAFVSRVISSDDRWSRGLARMRDLVGSTALVRIDVVSHAAFARVLEAKIRSEIVGDPAEV